MTREEILNRILNTMKIMEEQKIKPTKIFLNQEVSDILGLRISKIIMCSLFGGENIIPVHPTLFGMDVYEDNTLNNDILFYLN